MLISEKRSSIASLIAMGYDKRNIFYLFIALGTFFGLIGLSIGISLSVILSENLSLIIFNRGNVINQTLSTGGLAFN